MPRIHFTRRALLDAESIDLYSNEQWGASTAEKYLADIDRALDRISSYPHLLQHRDHLSLRLRFYNVREHLLVCDVFGDDIFILAIHGAGMDLPRRIAELEPQLVHEAEILAQRVSEKRLSEGQQP